MRQMAAEEQSDKMASHMRVPSKRGVTEFLHAEKMASIDIHWRLLNFYANGGCEHSEEVDGAFQQQHRKEL